MSNKTVYLFSHSKVSFLVEAFSEALSYHGIDNIVKQDFSEGKDNLWIGIWNRARIEDMPARFVTYSIETLRHGVWNSPLPYCFTHSLEIWDYCHSHIELLNSWGLKNCFLVPVGYSSSFEDSFKKNVPVVPEEKDIDVLFYGSLTKRRKNLIRAIKRSGLNIVWLGQDVGCDYGARRDSLISRSKIVVSCNKLDDFKPLRCNDFGRLSFLIANKIFTVSELWGDPGVEDQWQPYLTMKPFDEIVDTCRNYVDKPKERKDIVEAAYSYAVNNFNMRSLLPVENVRKLL